MWVIIAFPFTFAAEMDLHAAFSHCPNSLSVTNWIELSEYT